ncbi:MAG: PASTA domain-containing protein, partial [candidate division WOR-3 bacterium]
LTLAVSAPVGKFPMPNVLGMGLETASGIIASQGLVLGGVKQAPSDETAGLVLIQYPEEGMPVADGDSVHLIVAVPVVAVDSQP